MAYFKGQYGASSIPQGMGSVLSQGNAAIMQGIQKISDEIGGALKQRSKEAKIKKKETDMARNFLSLAFDKAEATGQPFPAIRDAEGNVMDLTKDDIPNLSYDQAVPAAAGLMQFQQFEKGQADIDSTVASTGLTGERSGLTSAQADATRQDMALQPGRIEAQINLNNANAAAITGNLARLNKEHTDNTNRYNATTEAIQRLISEPTPAGPFENPADKEKARLKPIFDDPALKGANWAEVMKMQNMIEQGKPFEPTGTTVTIDGKDYPMLATSRNSAVPANAGVKITPKPVRDEAIPGSSGNRRGTLMDDGTYENVYSVDRATRTRAEGQLAADTAMFNLHDKNLKKLKELKEKGVKKANYDDNPDGEDLPDVVVGEGGYTFGNMDIDDAIAREEAALNQYTERLNSYDRPAPRPGGGSLWDEYNNSGGQ